MKHVLDEDYEAAATDGGVIYTSLTAPRAIVLPPLEDMGKASSPIFPIANETNNDATITVRAAGSDLINGSSGATLLIQNCFQTILPVAGNRSWMF